MVLASKISIRHPTEAELLEQALKGDDPAVNKVFLYLSASNPHLRQIMQEAIHDVGGAELWKHLLSCLGAHCWEDHRDSDRRVDQEASQRIDQSIAEVFSQDEYEDEGNLKEAVLHEALNDKRTEIRYAAAYLLGLRGDKEMIPLLEEILDTAVKSWKVRAVRALAVIQDERCGPPLIKGLAMDRGTVHNECKEALIKMGPLMEKAWVDALNHPDSRIRWYAARGLGDPTEVRSVQVLAEGLMDENREVRWASADTLARIGPPGIPATLAVISRANLTTQSRMAAYHALHGVSSRRLRDRLKPLLEALQSPSGCVEAPAIAQHLLSEWENGH
jgi:HEAT repeat protein